MHLAQNRWQDLREAFRACNSVVADDPEVEKIEKSMAAVRSDIGLAAEER